MGRDEFTPAQRRAALERAQWRCQDPLCGRGAEWVELRARLDELGLTRHRWRGAASLARLLALRDELLLESRRQPRALASLIRRYQWGRESLLEVDHEQECADGGSARAENAVVRCVVCHQAKTVERARARRAAPRLAAKLAGTQLQIEDAPRLARISELQARIDAVRRKTSEPPRPDAPPPRRRMKEAEFRAALARRERETEEWPWGA